MPLAWLITPDSFTGVYLLEILFFSVALLYVHKISNLYLPSRASILILPATALLITTSNCFLRGDNAEEFCIPLLLASLYSILRFYHTVSGTSFRSCQHAAMPASSFFIHGIVAGCVLWIKFTMLGILGRLGRPGPAARSFRKTRKESILQLSPLPQWYGSQHCPLDRIFRLSRCNL